MDSALRLLIANIVLIAILWSLPPQQVKAVETVANDEIVEEYSQDPVEEIQEEPIQEVVPTSQMNISQNGIELIKQFEGCILTSKLYKGEPHYTIGYGHCSSDVQAGQTISQEEAERILINDIESKSEYVRKFCSHLELNQNQFDALVSFTYNVGPGNLLKLIKNRDVNEIANHIELYTNSGSTSNTLGLQRRRLAEKNLFLEVI